MPLSCPVTKPDLNVCPDSEALARLAAEQFVADAAAAGARAGRFAVALSGGSTPKALYALLASPEFRCRIDWPRVHVFWGDERCVPPDHPDSNFRMTRETLLDHAPLPARNIHRMAGEQEPEIAAAAYETELGAFFGPGWPRFDLILLGLGEDGHTASLFPHNAALDERQRPVAAVRVENLHPHRLSLTLPVLNASAHALFLVAGPSKKEIVEKIVCSADAPSLYPAARVRPENGRLTWLLSADAAAGLPPRREEWNR